MFLYCGIVERVKVYLCHVQFDNISCHHVCNHCSENDDIELHNCSQVQRFYDKYQSSVGGPATGSQGSTFDAVLYNNHTGQININA